jgi:hypothetical protein
MRRVGGGWVGSEVKAEKAADPVDASKLEALKWATPAVETDPKVGLDELLQALQLLGTDTARKAGTTFLGGTPPSLQVIKSGALASTKWVAGLVASVGGVTGAAAAVAGAIRTFSGDAGQPETVALIGGAAVLLGAVALALSVVVGTDLIARGMATSARHEGRAEVTSAFLAATGGLPASTKVGSVSDQVLLLALAAFPGRVVVTTDALTNEAVKGVGLDPGSRDLTYVLGTDRVKLSEIKSFKVT